MQQKAIIFIRVVGKIDVLFALDKLRNFCDSKNFEVVKEFHVISTRKLSKHNINHYYDAIESIFQYCKEHNEEIVIVTEKLEYICGYYGYLDGKRRGMGDYYNFVPLPREAIEKGRVAICTDIHSNSYTFISSKNCHEHNLEYFQKDPLVTNKSLRDEMLKFKR